MSFINIGKVIKAGSDITKLYKAMNGFETGNLAAKALNKYAKIGDNLKISALVGSGKVANDDEAKKLLNIADGVTDIGEAAVKSSGKMSKLKEGISGVITSAKTFVSAHKLAFGVGTVAATIATIATTAYAAYKSYKQNMINAATEATSAWDKSLSDVQNLYFLVGV